MLLKVKYMKKATLMVLVAALVVVAMLLVITTPSIPEASAQIETPATAFLPQVEFSGYEVLRGGDDWSVEVEMQALNGIAPVEDLKNLTNGGAVR